MKTFATLLRREWMQHRLGWIVTVALPLAVALVVLSVGQVRIDLDEETTVRFDRVPPIVLAVGAILGSAALTLLIAWFTALVQAPGLARRDRQDRSVEFWLSLPAGHVSSLLAPLAAHLVLFPMAAVGVGVASGFVVSLLLVAKAASLGEWFALPWGTMVPVLLAMLAHTLLGIVLATIWISPLVLAVMAASAWLRRWGLPAVVVATVLAGYLLERLYGSSVVWTTLQRLLRNAREALLGADDGPGLRFDKGADMHEQLAAVPGWIIDDSLRAIGALADPLLLFVAAASGAAFWLLVVRRKQGA